jgi:glyoxylase-like metal-dependent hydrolase (beta-lactamase superfamily II)
MAAAPRSVLAPNASPMTMGGTISYVVGRRRAVILDPGSAEPAHLDALAAAVRDAGNVSILLTHDHPDHSTGALDLARRLDAPVLSLGSGTLRDGQTIDTDEGELVVVSTPGHTPDHAAFHWPAARAAFCGDLMMGGLDTAVVAAPEGDLAAYLASLEKLRALRPEILYPAHGPPFTDPDAAIDRYLRHRARREQQVLDALAVGVRGLDEITTHVYGSGLDEGLRGFALAAIQAYLIHLRATGRLPDDVNA